MTFILLLKLFVGGVLLCALFVWIASFNHVPHWLEAVAGTALIFGAGMILTSIVGLLWKFFTL